MENIERVDDYLVDDNNNRSYIEHFESEEKAKKALLSLVNCKNCVDCVDCWNCKNCKNCEYCVNCKNCKNCEYCVNCKNCEYCVNCKNCEYCKNCKNCLNKKSLQGLKGSVDCIDSDELKTLKADKQSLERQLEEARELKEASLKVGFWLSAALDDDKTCEEMKKDIRIFFNALGIKEKGE